jgi:hypothetical protein
VQVTITIARRDIAVTSVKCPFLIREFYKKVLYKEN